MKLTPKDNVFAIDASLIIHYVNKWNDLTKKPKSPEEHKVQNNLKSFLDIIDFTKSEIDKIFYVGSEDLVETLELTLDQLNIETNPTTSTKNSLNDFSTVIVDNYTGIKDYPALSKGVVKLESYKQLSDFDKQTFKPKKWSISFSSNDINKELEDLSNKKDIQIITDSIIENNFRELGHVPWGSTLKLDQKVYPKDLFKIFSIKSEFIVIYDRYLFNYRNGADTIFGHKNKHKLDKDAFEALNLRLTFYLELIENVNLANKDKIFIIGGSKGKLSSDRELMNSYKNAINNKISTLKNKINDSDDELRYEKAELKDLELIKKYYDKFLMVQRETVGEKTGISHNRIIFNDNSFLEWGSGHSAFSRNGFFLDYWHINEQQQVSSTSICDVEYKMHNFYKERNKNIGAHNNKFEGLKSYCQDFENDIIPEAKG
tara:strand:+ start:135 stop:1424 length:1290 start_codon:yes stop_codon:yes gene_type:complete